MDADERADLLFLKTGDGNFVSTGEKSSPRWISPDIAKILAEKGRLMDGTKSGTAPGQHYEQL